MISKVERERHKEILILGNGFDLMHGLPTRYTDFLSVIRNEEPLLERIKSMQQAGGRLLWRGNLINTSEVNCDELDRMESILKANVWASFFKNNDKDISGWIDFEKEILSPISVFQKIWELNITNNSTVNGGMATKYNCEFADNYSARVAETFGPGIFGRRSGNVLLVKGRFVSNKNRIIKELFIDELIKEWDAFIEAFRIYIREIVEAVSASKIEWISELDVKSIISFNYTMTERKYDNLSSCESVHVHGTVACENSIVMGVDEISDDLDRDFIWFEKFFQRIQKVKTSDYKKCPDEKYVLRVIGHSLDKMDFDVIRPYFENAYHIIIHYYDRKDRDTKLINMIKMLGRDAIEEYIGDGKIELIGLE